jgi:hypothetical protein
VKVTVTAVLWPAGIVSGKESPLRVNSVVLIAAEEIVTADPVALSITGRLLLCPIPTLPKFRIGGLTPNTPAAVPVPDREMARVEFVASEATEILPLAFPAEVGVKTVPKV